ncbi:MAG: ABC transporter ATP-binding protein [Alphaproteobacteria bacterium]|nr:MAG: ABC transporter ATP-binding protein [Alphaproteobacteria bacterium]
MKSSRPTLASFAPVLVHLRPRWRGLLLVLALSLAASGLGLIQPWLTKILIDDGLVARNMSVVWQVAGVLVAVALLTMAIGALNRWAYVDLSARILFALREDVYAHLLTLSPRFFAGRKTGDIMVRLDGDIAEIQRFVTDSGLALVNGLIVFLGCLGVMLALSPMLTLIAFVVLPLQITYLRFMRPRVERATRALRARAGDIAGYLIERLRAVRLVQASRAEGHERALLSAHNAAYHDDLITMQLTSYFTGAGPAFLSGLATAALFVAGGALVVNDALSLGTLIAFSVYLARASGPVQTFLGLYVAAERARVSLDRVRELLDHRPLVRSPANPLSLPDRPSGEIRFESVTFSHPERREPILADVSLTIPAGAKVAITGPSGAGKSTIADLLVRFYDPDKGAIMLDGVDLRHLSLGTLRGAVALVAQDTVLLNATLADNIRYARPDASAREIRAAAEAAQLDKVIAALPAGLDTPLPELGATLSGGQRQRVAIARAFLQNPRVLVLDEATSGLDAATEAALTEAVDRLFAGRTRIVISHNPRALQGVDMELVLDAGRLRIADKKDFLNR